jgi:CIC family chloride channel protein
MFAIELMMPEVSVDTFLPVAIATGTATFVGRWFFGDTPAFHVPPLQAMAVNSNALIVNPIRCARCAERSDSGRVHQSATSC